MAEQRPMLRDEKGRLLPGTSGRPVGAVDKLTRTVKETVLAVFNELQEDPKHSLKTFAEKYPRDFYNIAAKLIPTDISADVKVAVEQITGMVIKKEDAAEI
jgi:hypothetical protein